MFCVRLVFSSSLTLLWLNRWGAFVIVLIICRTPVETLFGVAAVGGTMLLPFVSIIVGMADDEPPSSFKSPPKPLNLSSPDNDGAFDVRRCLNENDFRRFSVPATFGPWFDGCCCWLLLCRSNSDDTNLSKVPRSAPSLELRNVDRPFVLPPRPLFVDIPNLCVSCKIWLIVYLWIITYSDFYIKRKRRRLALSLIQPHGTNDPRKRVLKGNYMTHQNIPSASASALALAPAYTYCRTETFAFKIEKKNYPKYVSRRGSFIFSQLNLLPSSWWITSPILFFPLLSYLYIFE